MRPIFERVPRDSAGYLLLNTGGLLTETSERILTEDSSPINQERGRKRFLGWAADGDQSFVTANTPSAPIVSEGLAYDGDGAMHITYAAPSGAVLSEGVARSSTGALHVFDTSATLLTEGSLAITTEADAPIIAEARVAGVFSGLQVTDVGQVCYS